MKLGRQKKIMKWYIKFMQTEKYVSKPYIVHEATSKLSYHRWFPEKANLLSQKKPAFLKFKIRTLF